MKTESKVVCIHPQAYREIAVQSAGYNLIMQHSCKLCGNIVKTESK